MYPPSASTQSWILVSMLLTRFSHSCGLRRRRSYTVMQWRSNRSLDLSFSSSHSFTIIPQKFSIGFRSGDRAGQKRTSKSCSCSMNHCFTTLLLWIEQLSWTNVIRCEGSSSAIALTVGRSTSSRISTYDSPVEKLSLNIIVIFKESKLIS